MKRDRTNDPPKSARELLNELEQDPEYLARRKADEDEIARNRQVYAENAAPVLAELALAGFQVGSVGELVDLDINYKRAIPVLLKWLPRVTYSALKEDIVRTLSVPWAKPAAVAPLVREFTRDDDSMTDSVRWAIGNALEVLADDSIFDDLVRLVIDSRFGRARQMPVRALGKMKNRKAVAVLIGLLKDEDSVAIPAIAALGKLRAKQARSAIEPFLKDSRSWVRKDAAKALAKIDAATDES